MEAPNKNMKDMSRLNWMPTYAAKINTVQNIIADGLPILVLVNNF